LPLPEYGCEVKIVTEEYTSKCCRCGILSDNYTNRIKSCSNCNLKIDRDINGSRNILIKNWCGNYKTVDRKVVAFIQPEELLISEKTHILSLGITV